MTTRISVTRAQELLLLSEELRGPSPLNNMAFALTYTEAIDAKRMVEAFSALVKASDALRITFTRRAEGNGWTASVGDFNYVLPTVDVPAAELDAWLTIACRRSFNPAERCFDAALLRVSDGRMVLYLNQHHLITDGWGYALQLRFLENHYRGKEPEKLASFAAHLRGADATGDDQYWKEYVNGSSALQLFGRDNPDNRAESTRHVLHLDEARMAQLRNLTTQPALRSWTEDLSRFNLLATALTALLYRLGTTTDIRIGTPAHNRLTPAAKRTPGVFIELLPLCTDVVAGESLGELHKRVSAETMHFLRHAKPGSGSAEVSRSFNAVFNYINQGFGVDGQPAPYRTAWLHPGLTEPGHHLKLQAYDFSDTGRLTLCFDTNDAVVSPSLAKTIGPAFLEILDQLQSDPSTPVGRAGQLTARPAVVADRWDDTFPAGQTVIGLIEERMRLSGNATAVRAAGQSMTYAELDRYSASLAASLVRAGVRKGDVVGICLERSVEMVVGLLGIMRAGAAYLPIDPVLPADRRAFMLEDGSARILLTGADLTGELPVGVERRIIDLPQLGDEPTVKLPRVGPTDAMYVIYTSGSTGGPKGVLNEYRGPTNRLLWGQEAFRLTPQDVVLQKTSFGFDVSVWELFWPLIVGARLVMARPGGQGEPRYLREVIRAEGITTIHFVPPMLEAFLGAAAALPSLRRVLCSGEALLPHQVAKFAGAYPGVELHNLYGPTEAGIEVSHQQLLPGDPNPRTVPIGRSVTNVPLRIVRPADEELCPVGVPGELWIGGVQVARKYVNRPELTAEKFVRRRWAHGNPTNLSTPEATAPTRWYRSGDLAVMDPDGVVHYAGRIDQQVKFRGFRIEPGEIEATLNELPGVDRSHVQLWDAGTPTARLVGYVVGPPATQAAALLAALADRLPYYMVPSKLVPLPDLPLTPNGKLDRQALATLGTSGPTGAEATTLVAPDNEFEQILLDVWREVFGLMDLGVTTNFFDLGGHSLTALRVMNRVNESFEMDLPGGTVLQHPTVRALSDHVMVTMQRLLEESAE